MFRNRPHYQKQGSSESHEMQQLRRERDYLKEELFLLKNQSQSPKEISAVEIAGILVDGKTPLHIVLNPYVPFNVMTKLLGYAWISGCFGGLAIVFASGVLGLQLLSLVFLFLMIFAAMIMTFMYLDA